MSLYKVTSGCVIEFEDCGDYYNATAKGIDVVNGLAGIIATSVAELLKNLKSVMLVHVPDIVWDGIKDQLINDGYL